MTSFSTKTGLTAMCARHSWEIKKMIDELEKEARRAQRAMLTIPNHLKGDSCEPGLRDQYKRGQARLAVQALAMADVMLEAKQLINGMAK